jgi:S-adenosylmethionine decarboxylase
MRVDEAFGLLTGPERAHGVPAPVAVGRGARADAEGGDSPTGDRARRRLPPTGGDSRVEVDTVRSVGRHLVLELWGCRNLNSPDAVEQALREVVAACDVTLLDLRVYPFEPIGVTGVAVLAESHINIHTWPELGYAAVDIFTCGARKDPTAALPVLRQFFAPERIETMEMTRGIVLDEGVLVEEAVAAGAD